MKRLMIVLCVAAVVGLAAAAAQASITIAFDPDVLIQAYPSVAGTDVAGGRKVDQLDARRLHQPWGSTWYETFYNPAAPHTQSNDYNTYMNWRDSLGSGEGIAVFNSWFLNNPAAASWGETVVSKPGSAFTATAASGWNVAYIVNPYGLGGTSAQWYTTDSSKYINTTSAIGDFSITADLYWDSGPVGWDAGDTAVAVGDSVRFWLGNLNGDDPGFYRSDTQALYFDASGWGTRTSSVTPFSAIYATGANTPLGSGFEAALTATAIPEPATTLVWSLLGLVGLVAAGYGEWRRKQAG